MDYLRRYDIDSATARKDIRSFTETLEKNGILERGMMEKEKDIGLQMRKLKLHLQKIIQK